MFVVDNKGVGVSGPDANSRLRQVWMLWRQVIVVVRKFERVIRWP